MAFPRALLLRATGLCLLAYVAASTDCAASGPVRDAPLSVRDRQRNEVIDEARYVGSFKFVPQLGLGIGYTSNVFGNPDNLSDGVFRGKGSVALNSDWARHGMSASIYGQRTGYMRYDQQATFNAGLSGAGSINVSRALSIDAHLQLEKGRESRTAIEAPAGVSEPVSVRTVQSGVDANLVLRQVALNMGILVTSRNYSDAILVGGGVLDQDFRDRFGIELSLRAGLPVLPMGSGFIEVQREDYKFAGGVVEDGIAPLDPRRELQSTLVLAGWQFDASSLVRGEISVGAQFQDTALQEANQEVQRASGTGYVIGTDVEWLTSPITTARLKWRRALRPVGVSQSSGAVQQTIGIGVDHQLLSNLRLFSDVEYTESDFQNIERLDKIIRMSASAAYRMNRRVSVELDFRYFERESSGSDRLFSFTSHQLLLMTQVHL